MVDVFTYAWHAEIKVIIHASKGTAGCLISSQSRVIHESYAEFIVWTNKSTWFHVHDVIVAGENDGVGGVGDIMRWYSVRVVGSLMLQETG